MADRKFFTAEQLALAIQSARRQKPGTRPELDETLSGLRVLAPFSAQVEKIEAAPEDEESRILTFVAATADRNRNGWRINPDGWDLEAYQKNPVFLWAHDESSLPIGRSLETWVEANKLKAKVEFTPPGMSRFNDTVFQMYQSRFLNAVSVGFGVREWDWIEDADGNWLLDFISTELWEISAVPVGADPAALRAASAKGIDVTTMRQWARQMLEEPRFVLTIPKGSPHDLSKVAMKQFKDFYPSAKLFVLEQGLDIRPLAEDGPIPPKRIELEDLHLEQTVTMPSAELGATEDHHQPAAGEPVADPPAEGRSAPGADDPTAEGGIRGTRDWRIRELALLGTDV